MPFDARVFKIMVGSPADVGIGRGAVVEAVHEWNGVRAAEKQAVLLPVLWEIDAPPLAGQPPQRTINEELVRESDVLIALFWARLGTPTEDAESGTVEEIEDFLRDGKPVLVYLSNQPLPQDADEAQLAALQRFVDTSKNRVLFSKYDSIPDLVRLLGRHLPRVVNRLLGSPDSAPSPTATGAGTYSSVDSVQQRFYATLLEWDAERDSDPLGITDGKRVLEMLERVIQEAALVPDFDARSLGDLLAEIKHHGRYLLVMDGGTSFKRFWEHGDSLFRKAAELLDPLREERE